MEPVVTGPTIVGGVVEPCGPAERAGWRRGDGVRLRGSPPLEGSRRRPTAARTAAPRSGPSSTGAGWLPAMRMAEGALLGNEPQAASLGSTPARSGDTLNGRQGRTPRGLDGRSEPWARHGARRHARTRKSPPSSANSCRGGERRAQPRRAGAGRGRGRRVCGKRLDSGPGDGPRGQPNGSKAATAAVGHGCGAKTRSSGYGSGAER